MASLLLFFNALLGYFSYWFVMDNLSGVKNVIVVLSGKGGVGKSTLSVQIAYGLKQAGKIVGILDVDLCGPSIPRMLNLESSSIHQCDEGWVPVYASQDKMLSVISIGFLLQQKDDPVIWRGPKKTAMIKQFLTDVCWGELDFLVVDTPPGTSDEHLAVVEQLRNKISGAVLVTTPQVSCILVVRYLFIRCSSVLYKILSAKLFFKIVLNLRAEKLPKILLKGLPNNFLQLVICFYMSKKSLLQKYVSH